MKKMAIGPFSILPATIIFGHTAFAKSGKLKGSAEKDVAIKSEVEIAISMLQTIYSRHQKGEMTLEQAKQLGADLLRGLQYGKDGYFWADTTEGVNVVLYGRKDVEGKSRLEFKDSKGKFMLKEFIATAKAGGGYADYWFPKKGESTPVPKRGYVQLFKPFGWVVGTGYYL
jgi:methyl-accepting chemotaxis protein